MFEEIKTVVRSDRLDLRQYLNMSLCKEEEVTLELVMF